MWRNLIQARELLLNLVKRDLKARYKVTVLGFFWSIGKPLLYMLILWLVFSRIVKIEIRDKDLPFALHLLCGILPWMYLTSALTESMHSVLANGELVKKTRMPLEVLPVSAVLSNLVHFILALLVLLGFIVAFGVRLTPWVLALPLVILLQTFFLLGMALLLSSLFVFFRDVASILEVVLAGWFYITPIIYPIYLAEEMLTARGMHWAYVLLMINPLSPLIIAYRRVWLASAFSQPEMDERWLLIFLAIALLISLFIYFIGRKVFKHYSRKFADEL